MPGGVTNWRKFGRMFVRSVFERIGSGVCECVHGKRSLTPPMKPDLSTVNFLVYGKHRSSGFKLHSSQFSASKAISVKLTLQSLFRSPTSGPEQPLMFKM